jgi:YfiH family protein
MNAPQDWIVPQWPAPRQVRAIITTRSGGVSGGPYASFNLGDLTDDEPEAVSENKRRLDALLPNQARWLHQVHSARVVRAETASAGVQADASYTHTESVVCAVKIADCMPVLLCDRSGGCVGIAHAGWRGLAQGVVENTIRAMSVDPGSLYAYLGPAIGPKAFEVGRDVLDAFCLVDPAAAGAFQPLRPGKWLADLFVLGRQRLARAGVTEVYGGGVCTVSDPERFFSHRRDRVTGRMAALIWRDRNY